MVRSLLIRGMIAGFLASLLAFGFAKVVGEPQVDRAIAFEEQMEKASGHHDETPELVSREVQSGIGLFVGVGAFGTAVGGLFALVFAFAYGRVGALRARAVSALMALFGFVAFALVPFLKYPPNPPSVGDPGTIGWRTAMFFAMLGLSLAALVLALLLARKLAARLGAWNAALAAGAAFLILVLLAQWLLPEINEVPERLPAVLLWRFRVASFGIQAVLWTGLGVLFGGLVERLLEDGRGAFRVA
ncbi:CbtA family protein [Chromobacterium vaccinii]|uniref:CbtA family protein n=1 Tax=Chromobacterium vaccinii TaxID=1108595 RepID=UPI003C707116